MTGGRFGSRRVARGAWAAVHAELRARPARLPWLHALFMAEQPVDRAVVRDAGLLEVLLGLGLVRDGPMVTQMVRLDLVADLVIAADLLRHRRAADWVVRPGPASRTLARYVRANPGRPVLDLGSGSGVQGLLAAGPSTPVTALDINPRAVAMTRFNAGLNGRRRVRAEVGDFLTTAPDRRLDDRFGTVIANPPFVMAPSTELVFRDRPLPGDEVGGRTVERVARALAPGGRGYLLCNWIDRGGRWDDPPRAWLAAAGRTGAAVRLASLGVGPYAEFWTRDEPAATRPGAIAAWTAALTAESVERIHLGLIALARPDRAALHVAPRFVALDGTDRSVTPAIVEARLAA